MPYSPKRYCSQPGCSVIVPSGRCAQHAREPFRSPTHSAAKRIRGTHLQRLRRELFERTPLCVICEQAGRVTIATVRDHIVPLSQGGSELELNCQALCYDCNERKRHDEVSAGMAKWTGG